MANIKVAIKVRPLIDREKKDGENVCWQVRGNSISQIDPSGTAVRDGYTFDNVFGMDVSNSEIFEKIVKPLVRPTVDGFNTTIFAYGQTSSGKTYTMLGNKEEPGIIPLTVSAMFEAMQCSSGREFLVRASYMEIYNEKINDLLDKKLNLKIREEDGKAVVPGLKEELVTTTEKVLSLMRRGQKNRHIGETNMNERSSRSHTIFRLVIESREARGSQGDCSEDDDIIKVSHLNMVDLAGSERSDQTGNKFGSDRFREGCHINLSLFKLSQVISQLSDGKKYISFRDSKLTRILEPALGGNALTAIICNVTPASIDETNCTLSFASRAKKIKNEPHVNEVLSNGTLLKRYACQLAKLKDELEKAKSQDVVQEMESKLLEKDRLNTLLQERINRLSKQLIGACASHKAANGSGVGVKKGPPLRRKTWAGAALGILPFARRMEPIPESPVPVISVSKSTRNTSSEVIPFEEFERDLLESDELIGTPADFDEFFPSSFVNFRRGSERNKSRCEVFDYDTANTDEQIDQASGAEDLDQASGAEDVDQATGGESVDQATGGESADHATGGESADHATGDESADHATGGERAEHATGGERAEHATGGERAEHATGGERAEHATGGERADQATGGERADQATGGENLDNLNQATQTEQSCVSNSQALWKSCSTAVLPIIQRLNVSCQTSPATNRSLDLSCGSVAAETPPHIIRARLKELQKEYEELREFTKLERQIYEENAEMVSISVQTTPPHCTRDTNVRFSAQDGGSQSYTEIDNQLRVSSYNEAALIDQVEAPKSQISSNFEHQNGFIREEKLITNGCDQNLIPRETPFQGDNKSSEKCSYSLVQLRSKLDELTVENSAQKSEILTLNSKNEKLRNKMLTEIATLSQAYSEDEANSFDNLAIFDKFVNSIIQKEQEVVKMIIEESTNKLSAKENWINQLEKQVLSLEEELENSQKEKTNLHDKFIALKETLTVLEKDRLHLNKKLTKTEADVSLLHDENKELTLHLKTAEEKILKLSQNEKYLLLNIEKEKEQRTLIENDLCKTKEKLEELKNNLESTLRNDEKLLLSETETLKKKIQKLEEENSFLVGSIKSTEAEFSEAKAAATQNSECLKSVKKQLIALVAKFPDSNSMKYHSFEQILAFISDKLSESCNKYSQLTYELQKMKLESETLKQNLAVSLEEQKQLHYTNVSVGSQHLEEKDMHNPSSSVVFKPPFQSVGDSRKVSFYCGADTLSESLPVKDTDVSNQKNGISVGVNTLGCCRCEELEKENKQLIQESVARRCKIAQLQEEVLNQATIIEQNNSALKEAQHKIRVYKMELKQLQRSDRTSSQVNQSRTCCDAGSQTDDVRMYINYGCGVVTETLAENLRMCVFDLRKKNEKLTLLCRTQTDKVNMLENKITELRGEKKTYSNARVQTDDKREINFSNKEIQVDMFPDNASQHGIAQILFWKNRAEQRLEEKKYQVTLCAKLKDQIKELKQKPEPLAIRNLAYTLHDVDNLCLGHPKPPGKENIKYPYIDKS